MRQDNKVTCIRMDIPHEVMHCIIFIACRKYAVDEQCGNALDSFLHSHVRSSLAQMPMDGTPSSLINQRGFVGSVLQELLPNSSYCALMLLEEGSLW